jgi:hypothetical protein
VNFEFVFWITVAFLALPFAIYHLGEAWRNRP